MTRRGLSGPRCLSAFLVSMEFVEGLGNRDSFSFNKQGSSLRVPGGRRGCWGVLSRAWGVLSGAWGVLSGVVGARLPISKRTLLFMSIAGWRGFWRVSLLMSIADWRGFWRVSLLMSIAGWRGFWRVSECTDRLGFRTASQGSHLVIPRTFVI